MASATAIVRVALGNGCGHEDVGNAHLKDRDKGEVLQRVKKVGAYVRGADFTVAILTPSAPRREPTRTEVKVKGCGQGTACGLAPGTVSLASHGPAGAVVAPRSCALAHPRRRRRPKALYLGAVFTLQPRAAPKALYLGKEQDSKPTECDVHQGPIAERGPGPSFVFLASFLSGGGPFFFLFLSSRLRETRSRPIRPGCVVLGGSVPLQAAGKPSSHRSLLTLSLLGLAAFCDPSAAAAAAGASGRGDGCEEESAAALRDSAGNEYV